MAEKESQGSDQGRRDEKETSRPARRPYATPRVETYPLFERMALNCSIELKNTGEDDFS